MNSLDLQADLADLASLALPENLPKTVVIAEDDPNAQELVALCLETAGYTVVKASAGQQALDLIREHRPSLLICDWQMPGSMDGLELCRQVREDSDLDPLYIVMLTARRDKKDLVTALDTGADDYVAKPWDPQELLARVRAGQRIVYLQHCLALRNGAFQRVADRLNRELEVVSDIQKALLPRDLPQTDAFDLSMFYMPSTECGGDYYDVIRLDDRRLGFVIADVSGHGAPAMVAMALLRQNVHTIAHQFEEPHGLLEELNRLLFDHLPTEQYATMLYAIIDTETRLCRYASAGHNPPLWFHKSDGTVSPFEYCQGFPLKLVTRDATYATHDAQLEPDDKLVLYTDGIPECFNSQREIYGAERLQAFVRDNAADHTAVEIETQLMTDVLQFADSHPPEDDLTLVIVGVN